MCLTPQHRLTRVSNTERRIWKNIKHISIYIYTQFELITPNENPSIKTLLQYRMSRRIFRHNHPELDTNHQRRLSKRIPKMFIGKKWDEVPLNDYRSHWSSTCSNRIKRYLLDGLSELMKVRDGFEELLGRERSRLVSARCVFRPQSYLTPHSSSSSNLPVSSENPTRIKYRFTTPILSVFRNRLDRFSQIERKHDHRSVFTFRMFFLYLSKKNNNSNIVSFFWDPLVLNGK